MKQTIQLRLGQQLTMTPQLQQAIRLLQLSTLELRQEIQEALDTNLMLEEGDTADPLDGTAPGHPDWEYSETRASVDPREDSGVDVPPEPAPDRELRVDSAIIPDELPVDTQWSDVFDHYAPALGSDGDGDVFDPLVHQSRPLSLRDHLAWQLNLGRLSERDIFIALAVIDAIDDDGYLRAETAELLAAVAEAEVLPEELETVIHWIQSLDPPGVGARHLMECLAIQLRQLPAETPARDLALTICRAGAESLPRQDTAALARQFKCLEPDLRAALALIRTLNPHPGARISATPPDYVIPDLFVRRQDGRWLVEINPETLPRLRVNAQYAQLIRRSDQSADGLTLKTHLQEARWFIKSLASRNDTVLRVGAKIVELQQGFFERGEEGMRPLVLRDIAEALELHESTVSRVTTRKYMHTPRGTFEFKYFFSSHVNTTSGGECSSTAIRALIRRLIAGESPGKPLSDSRIASALAGQGIDVARRTVAKYREAMGIPSSNERKRLA